MPAGALADFDAEEARLRKLPDDQLIAVMDRGQLVAYAGMNTIVPPWTKKA